MTWVYRLILIFTVPFVISMFIWSLVSWVTFWERLLYVYVSLIFLGHAFTFFFYVYTGTLRKYRWSVGR